MPSNSILLIEGADVPFDEIFLRMRKELWVPSVWGKGCTDMAARGRATLDGSTLLAHTNDLCAELCPQIVAMRTFHK